MSKTFAVETNSGGSPRICSIETLPAFRSFFSWARLTRMSFARLSASILWSRDHTGACTGVVWGGTMSAASYQPPSRVQLPRFRLVCHFGNGIERNAEHIIRVHEARACRFCIEFFAHTRGCIPVGEEHRAECNVCRTARDQLQCVASCVHTAHADDRQ